MEAERDPRRQVHAGHRLAGEVLRGQDDQVRGAAVGVVRERQHVAVIQNFVFPITALYFGPLALAFYWRWARVPARAAAMSMTTQHPSDERRPGWVTMAIETSHCGSGCALGDLIAEFAIFWLALSIAGLALGAEYIGDYLLALAFGIVFQYFAIAPMRGLGVRDGLTAAAKADVISLTALAGAPGHQGPHVGVHRRWAGPAGPAWRMSSSRGLGPSSRPATGRRLPACQGRGQAAPGPA